MADKEYYQFTSGKPLPSRILLHAPDLSAPYEKCTLQELVYQNQIQNSGLYIAQQLGSTVIATTLNINPFIGSQSLTMANGRPAFFAIYLPDCTVTGISWCSRGGASYTANNFNGFALYQYSPTQWTLVAQTTNTASIWTTSNGIAGSLPLTSPYTATAGVYLIACFFNGSAVTTSPTMMCAPGIGPAWAVALTGINTNLYCFQTSSTLTSPPSSLSLIMGGSYVNPACLFVY